MYEDRDQDDCKRFVNLIPYIEIKKIAKSWFEYIRVYHDCSFGDQFLLIFSVLKPRMCVMAFPGDTMET